MKIVFMGTPDFSKESLEAIYNAGHEILAVVTNPDRPKGRGMKLVASPVKEYAVSKELKIYQPEKIRKNEEFIQEMKKLNPDVICVVAYGKILPTEILQIPRLGCINVHASLLPRLRGGAPLHHALIDGEEKTGVTIMYMDKTMDTGDIISTKEYIIKDTDNVGTIHDTLSPMGRDLLLETLPSIIEGTNKRIPQNHDEATFAWNIKREEEHIDFNRTAREVFNQVRGLNPWPKAHTIIDGVEIKVLECYISDIDSKFSSGTICDIKKDSIGICTKDKVVYITKVKPFGKKEMLALDYINGINKEKILHSIVG